MSDVLHLSENIELIANEVQPSSAIQNYFIQATARKNEIELQVDFRRLWSTKSYEGGGYVSSDGKFYVGSHPDKTTLPEIATRSDFLGCIKDIEINDFPVEIFPKMMVGKVKYGLPCN